MLTPLPTLTGKSYLYSECRTPLPLAHSILLPLDISPSFYCSPAPKQPRERLLIRAHLWGTSYRAQGFGLGVCEEVREVGGFYQSWL